MMGGEHTVHMGIALLDPGADHFLTGHAAAQEDLLRRMAALGVGQCAQIAEYALLRVFPDGAGVHNHHIGTFGLPDDGIAGLGQIAPEFFGVGFILLAAVGFHIGGGSSALCLPESGNFITFLLFQAYAILLYIKVNWLFLCAALFLWRIPWLTALSTLFTAAT